MVSLNYIRDLKLFKGHLLPDIYFLFNCSEYKLIRLHYDTSYVLMSGLKNFDLLRLDLIKSSSHPHVVRLDLPNWKFSRLKKYDKN